MCKSVWLCLLAATALPSMPANAQSVARSVCEVRSAMSAACPCIWSAMLFNLSPERRIAVVEERFRTVFPEPGEWNDGGRMRLPLRPWERYFVGCKRVARDGEDGDCGLELTWAVVSCEAAGEQG